MGALHQLIIRQGIEEARRLSVGDKTDRLCVDAAYGVLSDERSSIGIAHAGFAMAALPHRRISEPVWEREGGQIKLLVESGLDRAKQPVGVPYGAVARMILLYLQTEAVKTRSREVELGASMSAWLAAMDISKGGKTYHLVRDQSQRISRCRLTFFRRTAEADMVTNGAFVRDAILPLDAAGQLSLWQEKVTLDEGFYRSLLEHPLPLREAAIRQISNRSMAIDLYVWLAYRLHVLTGPVEIGWAALSAQFGAGYGRLRDFRRDLQPSLKMATAVYPEAHVEVDEEAGLTLYPSKPPIAERQFLR